MTTMAWLEYKEQFLRYFCLPSIRDNYRWKLLHILRGDRSVEEYIYEFLRLSHHVVDVMHDERNGRAVY